LRKQPERTGYSTKSRSSSRTTGAWRLKGFQVKLAVREDNKATLTCEDSNYNVVFTTEIEYRLSEPGITLWFSDNMIFLPSEY
jgi:hypothetical protein